MLASTLNKRIYIEKEVTTTNAVGTPVETYSYLKETWASMRLLIGNTQFSQDGELPFSSTEFIVRYDDRIDYKCRIKYDGQYYRINHIHEQGRKDFYRILALVWEEN